MGSREIMPHFNTVIMNPPYDNYFIHTRICSEVKKHTDNAIAICPINKATRYRTCEFADKPFGDQIAWNNVFIMDLMGENNEYFSTKNSIFVKHTTDPFYTMWYKNGKYIIDNSERNLELGHNLILDENRLDEIQKFFDWLNTTDNEIVKNSTHITTVRPSRYNINKLWEIYQNEKG